MAGGHASDGLQDDKFVLSYFIAMVMVAVYIRAFAEEEVEIAQFHLLDAVQLVLGNTLEVDAIHALAILVPFHDLGLWWWRWTGWF